MLIYKHKMFSLIYHNPSNELIKSGGHQTSIGKRWHTCVDQVKSTRSGVCVRASGGKNI